MAEKPYTANDVAAIDAANFNRYKNTNEEREAIATPSLTFSKIHGVV